MSPHDIEPTYIAYANCGTPYFFCRAHSDYHEVIKAEIRYVRRRGGEIKLKQGYAVHVDMQKMLKHWPKTNPVQTINAVMFRIHPSTYQE